MAENSISRQETKERLRLERALALLQSPAAFELWVKWQRRTYQQRVNPLRSFLETHGVHHVHVAEHELVAGQSVAELPAWAVALLSKTPARAIHSRYIFNQLHGEQEQTA